MPAIPDMLQIKTILIFGLFQHGISVFLNVNKHLSDFCSHVGKSNALHPSAGETQKFPQTQNTHENN